MSGFPSFDTVEIQRIDYVLMILYMICGCVLAYFYETTHAITEKIADKIPGIIKETLAGLLLGLTGMAVPAVMFSGEEQMEVLMRDYAGYFSIVLIAIAFLKVLLTNVCIQFGLKGGHFFPVIFAGVCMGYGVAMLCFGKDGSHVVFAAAIVTATLLGGIMKKPLAVTMLLFLCFPVKMFLWIFIAAAVGSKCSKK
ncbi:chloride channel protein [Dorea longicatena]|uniref:chloride channel protein n=1 Tax=Dorea longicatena TaxID=88431 RepID=UPI0032C04520